MCFFAPPRILPPSPRPVESTIHTYIFSEIIYDCHYPLTPYHQSPPPPDAPCSNSVYRLKWWNVSVLFPNFLQISQICMKFSPNVLISFCSSIPPCPSVEVMSRRSAQSQQGPGNTITSTRELGGGQLRWGWGAWACVLIPTEWGVWRI